MLLAYGHEPGEQPGDIDLDLERRLRSIYFVGSSTMGKSAILECCLAQDARDDVAGMTIDFENRLIPRALRHQADHGRQPVVIDPTLGHIPLNVLTGEAHPHTILEGVMQAFERAWHKSWGDRLDDILRHSLMLLMEHQLTLGELPLLLSRRSFRERLAQQSQDERVRLFFLDHIQGISSARYTEWIESTRNKVAKLIDNPWFGPSLSCETCLDFRALMDSGTSLDVNLPESVLGDSAKLYAMLLVSKVYQAALQRPKGSRPFFVYADEFQNCATNAFMDLAVRSAKRGVGSIMSHQSIDQPPFDENRGFISTITSTVGTMVVMRVGRSDAEYFASRLFPATGTQPKQSDKHWLWGESWEKNQPRYSVQEEREHQMSLLESQQQRECYIRTGGATYTAEAYDVPEPKTSHEDGQHLARERVQALGVPLKEVEAAHEARMARFSPRQSKRKSSTGD